MVKRAAVLLILAITALMMGRVIVPNDDRPDEVADLILVATLLLPVAVAHALVLGEAVRGRSIKPLLPVWLGVLSGAGAGALLGIGLRVGMRAVAIVAGEPTSFSIGGSVFVLMLGVILGATFGGLYSATRRWLPEHSEGLVFGLLVGALFWFPFFEAAAGDLRGVVSELSIVVLTSLLSALWIGYGAVLGWLVGRNSART